MSLPNASNIGAPNTLSTLNGFFKIVYGDKLQELVPEGVKIAKMIPFMPPAKRMGSSYKQPLALTLEHGVSDGGSAGNAFELNKAINGATKEASVEGYEMVLRGNVSIGAISRSSANPAASFGRATKHVIKNLMTSSFKKHETRLMYGQSPLGIMTATAAATVTNFVVDAAEWASGIWAGGEGMKVSIWNATEGRWIAVGRTIDAVDIENRTLTLNAATLAVNAIDDVLEIYESSMINPALTENGTSFDKDADFNVMVGLHKMLTATTGNIFGVSTASYSLWRGNQYIVPLDTLNAKVPLSYKHISKGIAQAVAKGVEGKLLLVVSPERWADLLDAQTSKRSFDSSYGSAEYKEGSEKITFHSQNGVVEIIASTYCKNGYAYALSKDCFSRVGSSDITFKLPGTSEDFVIKPENAHAIEFRTYCDVALFCDALGTNVVFSNFSVE